MHATSFVLHVIVEVSTVSQREDKNIHNPEYETVS